MLCCDVMLHLPSGTACGTGGRPRVPLRTGPAGPLDPMQPSLCPTPPSWGPPFPPPRVLCPHFVREWGEANFRSTPGTPDSHSSFSAPFSAPFSASLQCSFR